MREMPRAPSACRTAAAAPWRLLGRLVYAIYASAVSSVTRCVSLSRGERAAADVLRELLNRLQAALYLLLERAEQDLLRLRKKTSRRVTRLLISDEDATARSWLTNLVRAIGVHQVVHVHEYHFDLLDLGLVGLGRGQKPI